MRIRLCTFIALTAVTASTHAQLRLPSLTVPATPLQGLSLQSLPQSLAQADDHTVDRVTRLRHVTIERLLRSNRRVLEADPNGEPMVRGELLAFSLSESALEHARTAGFLVARQQIPADGELRLTVLTAPSGLSTQRALQRLREFDPDGVYDYNHIYLASGSAPTAESTSATPESALSLASLTVTHSAAATRIGLLDTGVDATHPIFRDSVMHAWGCANKSVPGPHGTAVASLFLAHDGVQIYSADVYCGLPTGGAVDTLIGALSWMSAEHVPVINVSLVGPHNALLEKVIAAMIARGHLIVAAVGNDGPTAPPLYPAAYPNVIGVTAVDAKRRVLLEACRGPQVTFAAAGADLEAATINRGFADVRGTSFAAPRVARLLAELLSNPSVGADAAVQALAAAAIDLGAPGKDVVYGFGLVGTTPIR